MNTTVRNVLIVLAIAAVVALVQGGVTAANVAIQAVTLAFLGHARVVRVAHLPRAPGQPVLARGRAPRAALRGGAGWRRSR